MSRNAQTVIRVLTMLLIISIGTVVAQDYAIDWHTVDGGGEVWNTGGDYVLGGTIGQPDAGAMTGGTYTLTGGFWSIRPCWCLSDINNDGLRNGEDVQAFVKCFLATGSNCACADLETDGVLDVADVATFVDDLLSGVECP